MDALLKAIVYTLILYWFTYLLSAHAFKSFSVPRLSENCGHRGKKCKEWPAIIVLLSLSKRQCRLLLGYNISNESGGLSFKWRSNDE